MLGLIAKGKFQSFVGAKKIGGNRKIRPFDLGKEQGGAACGDNASMYFGDFQVRIDFFFDNQQLVLFFKYFQITPKILEFRHAHGLLLVIAVMR